jgi:hypothetical protein
MVSTEGRCLLVLTEHFTDVASQLRGENRGVNSISSLRKKGHTPKVSEGLSMSPPIFECLSSSRRFSLLAASVRIIT